ncbi:hypothetical protein N0V93_004482 [Gnomoniopsis smithogilvyi]|uniref:Fe2OG dioxygenase domain-containing protein n=1 Tax=Gnomoniopsis smithogilvyi TaxID=1191159 RepID=A0A9W8YSH2_9PEZI|nr:hypothetical protein N0V93_004482 [Gnomoniopsis smithogilvyi]
MATDFSALPIVDLSPLSNANTSRQTLNDLSTELDRVFRTTGFAYLTNPPLSFCHEDVFGLAHEFFSLPVDEKMKAATKMFVGYGASHQNTYRGYFPPQSGNPDNLKEGFEIGPGKHEDSDLLRTTQHARVKTPTIQLNEANVWPSPKVFPRKSKKELEQLYRELQTLSRQLLSLLAVALGESEYIFEDEGWMNNSISTLRLLHYPPQPGAQRARDNGVKLCCTPHTDSGILTLLHQDPTGGLEVRNARGEWVAAPYLPGSLVVNIGDLMARVSGGRYVATMHRVRAGGSNKEDGMGRFSVPFFFEPGEDCLIRSVEGDDEGVRYGEHVRAKMDAWVEFKEIV